LIDFLGGVELRLNAWRLSSKVIIQHMKKKLTFSLSPADQSRLIEMAWEDRTTFEAIKAQYGFDESALKKLMQSYLKAGSYRLWRKRVKQRSAKHHYLRACKTTRAYTSTQYKLSR